MNYPEMLRFWMMRRLGNIDEFWKTTPYEYALSSQIYKEDNKFMTKSELLKLIESFPDTASETRQSKGA